MMDKLCRDRRTCVVTRYLSFGLLGDKDGISSGSPSSSSKFSGFFIFCNLDFIASDVVLDLDVATVGFGVVGSVVFGVIFWSI